MDTETFETLAMTACNVIKGVSAGLSMEHGIEVAPGFFNIYNERTGQSSTVLYHPETNMIFKLVDEHNALESFSRHHVGDVFILGQTFKVRLPEYRLLLVEEGSYNGYCDLYIAMQEYVVGDICECDGYGWCDHGRAIAKATRCSDTHSGNWKIVGDEIILFDFEGIALDTDND